MCLILFSYKQHPGYKLILASNRDEFYDRPTKSLCEWGDKKTFLAGKDEQSGGTWMGITRDLRIAAITNYRDLSTIKNSAPSRGLLVRNYLESDALPYDYLTEIQKNTSHYNGFNLMVGNTDELYCFSNVSTKIEKIEAGLHGLSNRFINTPWPKVKRGKQKLAKIIANSNQINTDKILDLLADDSPAPDNELPDTGVGIEWERALSPIFIRSEKYGTRASSIILIDWEGHVTFIEKSFLKTSSEYIDNETIKMVW